MWCMPYPDHVKSMINDVEARAKKELNDPPDVMIYRGSEIIPNFQQFYKKEKKTVKCKEQKKLDWATLTDTLKESALQADSPSKTSFELQEEHQRKLS